MRKIDEQMLDETFSTESFPVNISRNHHGVVTVSLLTSP